MTQHYLLDFELRKKKPSTEEDKDKDNNKKRKLEKEDEEKVQDCVQIMMPSSSSLKRPSPSGNC